MVTRLEKEQLTRSWKGQPQQPTATVAKCAAGLVLLFMIALVGNPASGEVAPSQADSRDHAQRRPG
jgi:hypothetical protein